jgi:hypothetical protein
MTEQKKPIEFTVKERIERLENWCLQTEQLIGQIINAHKADMELIGSQVKNSADKLEAFVRLANSDSKPTKENLNKEVMEVTAEQLKASVDKFVADGYLKETEEIKAQTFVVLEQVDAKTNNIISTRTQGILEAFRDKELLLNHKKGDSIAIDDNVIFNILEVYDIVQQEVQKDEVVSEEPQQKEQLGV